MPGSFITDDEGRGPMPLPIVERRGLDAAVIALIKQLHEQFVEAHAHVHDTFVASHEREHNLRTDATEDALRLSAEKLRQVENDIRHYYDGIMSERDHRYAQGEEASQRAIQAAFEASEKAVASALEAKDRAVASAFESAEKAIAKAETSIEKRADATYVALAELQRLLGGLMPRVEAEQRFSSVDVSLSDLRDRVKGIEAIKQGGRETLSAVQMAFGLILAVITIVGFIYARAGVGP